MLRRRAAAPLLLVALSLIACNSPPAMMGSDGSTDDAGTSSHVIVCPGASMSPLASGVCAVSGSGAGLLIQADVLAPGQVYRGGQVFVDATGSIACVACDCSATAGASSATRVTCPRGVVSPGLINAHEHITYQGTPRAYTAERYEHRHDWRQPAPGHTHPPTPRAPMPAVNVPWAELRMVMGGATSINADISALAADGRGFLRDLDNAGDEEGLGHAAAVYDTFPLDDLSSYYQAASGCDGYSTRRVTTAQIAHDSAYTPHIAEGIGASARNEFTCQSSGLNDLIQPQTAMIHGVGLLPRDMQQVAVAGTTLIWSPRSNISLYGDTARVVEYDRMGVAIAMGTDWIYSGSMNMLRELQCADELNSTYFGSYFSDEALWRMVTVNGATALGVDDVLGTIAVGRVADLSIFDGSMHVDHRAVIDATPGDVVLVLRGGVPLYGEDAVVAGIPSGGTGCDTIDVCGHPRRACVMREIGMTLGALTTANAGLYPLFDCSGMPHNEPTCRPERDGMGTYPSPMVNGSTIYSGMTSATDRDGDGIPDAMDNCPNVFNPIRPLDMGTQADGDTDGLGDSCDPCPLDAHTTTCSMARPGDADNDMVPDAMDNCPSVANTNQLDTDHDGRGDACDPCPMVANPGTSACPATIYQVKNGMMPVGTHVVVAGVVTALGPTGFFMQVPLADPAYTVPEQSGVYVESVSAPSVTAGTTVQVDGTIVNISGELALMVASVTVGAAATIPDPIVVTSADVATGGTRAAGLEGVLVRIASPMVTDLAPAPAAGDPTPTNEFVVDTSLRVDDGLYLITPSPVMGELFGSLTGVLAFRFANSKLLPRGAGDVVSGPPRLASLGPALSYVRVGGMGVPTFPMPLTVQLLRPAPSDTMVAVMTSDSASLRLPGASVTVPAGMTSATVLVGAIAMTPSVTITATLGATQMASVRVLGASEGPTTFTLSPNMVSLGVGRHATFTATLDVPALAGGQSITLAETTGGMLPAMVLVPQDQVSAMFSFTAGTAPATGTLTASALATMQTAALTITAGPPPHFVINEVDYDQPPPPTSDSMEFVEIYNPGTAPLSLDGLSLVLVNGSNNTVYTTVDLSTAVDVPAGGYLVVGAQALLDTITADREIAFAAATNAVQNGAPDGLAIYDATSGMLVDALSYEGAITATTISGHTFSLVEGTALPASVADSGAGSLARIPNGRDTDDAASDWMLAATPTPGAAN